jgi:hypothetical protein
MADLYTPKEATALYNRCKIMWDPTSYTLSDGLKLTFKCADLRKLHIRNVSFGAEFELVRLIHAFHKVPDHAQHAYIDSIFPDVRAESMSGNTDGPQPADVAFCKKDDMCIALDYLKNLGFKPGTIKGGRLLEAIVQTCVALSSPKSCCADLHWLGCKDLCTRSYKDLHTFKHLTDALKDRDATLPVYSHRNVNLVQTVPAPFPASDATIGFSGLSSTKKSCFDMQSVETQMFYTYLYCLEVLWATHSLPDPRLKELANAYLSAGVPHSDKILTDDFYTVMKGNVVLVPEVQALIEINNPEARFEAYKEFILKHNLAAKAVADAHSFLAGNASALLCAGHGSLVGFAQTFSNTWVRVNNCKILYEYAATNGLLENPKDYDAEDFDTGIADMIACTGTDPMATTASVEKESPDLMELSTGHPVPKHGTPGATSYVPPTYEALDKTKAKFVDGKYTFDTEDRVDFSEDAKKRYETIANKVRLVNRLLTQRLREIKTYNTGGKHSGLPSGRLDRKAVYRYHYDPNIFYNNTYKQLESDLAFGIVLDISGSMCGKGIENGRITMIVLHETLKALGINHSIIGHTSHGPYKCTIERYQAFREDKTYHTRKNYAIANLSAQSGNCDSASLYYMEHALMRTKNKDKICLIFSDGQPTECTGTDLREQVAHMERNGIKVIGIGINFPEIAEYYKDYANGKNLTDMLTIVTNILKEYILKKKERA